MKFVCDQKTLSKSINIISKAVSQRSTMPVLKGILLETKEDGMLKVSASDLDMTIEHKIKVDIIKEGSVVVPAKFFGDIIRKLPGEKISILSDDNNVKIDCLNSQFTIAGMDADEFPTIKDSPVEGERLYLDSTLFMNMIKKTSFAASVDNSKPILTGVYIELKQDSMTMVAIDGFRVAVSEESAVNEKETSVIISAKMLNEIAKIIGENNIEGNIEVIANKKSAIFLMDDIKIVVKIFEGQFIDYERIIPDVNRIKIILNRNDITNAIERASLVSRGGTHNLIKLSIAGSVMTVSSMSEEGIAKEDVLIEKTGDDIDIGFNAKYLLDVLKIMDQDRVVMKLNDNISFGMIETEDEKSYKYVICPVRIAN